MSTNRGIMLRALVAASVLISSGSLGYVIYQATCETCGKSMPEVQAAPDVSDEGNRRIDRIANTITKQDRLSAEEAAFLLDSVDGSDEIVVQRWALACMAEHLRKQSTMAPETTRVLEDTIVRCLSSHNQRLVICAIACCEQSGLIARQDVKQKILSLRDDGNAQIASRASRSVLP